MRRLVKSRLIRIYSVILRLIFCSTPYLQEWVFPNSKMEESILETQRWIINTEPVIIIFNWAQLFKTNDVVSYM